MLINGQHDHRAMSDSIREIVVRRVQLRQDLKPVEIYVGDPPRPIDPDWVAITHATGEKGLESYNLVFFRFDGTPITWEQFDTLRIALDQAHAIVGVDWSEWTPCRVEIMHKDGSISWDDVTRSAEPGASPNGGPAAPFGNSGAAEGPPSVS